MIQSACIAVFANWLASQLAKTAIQADWITSFSAQAWDLSDWISNDSVMALILHGMIGFDVSPTQLQVIFYMTATLTIWFAARYAKTFFSISLRPKNSLQLQESINR